jgi:glycerol-3-phosphate dehydrogenase
MTGTFVRADALARLADERFDVVVVGGGITGAGVALDAASRGLRTALVERDDFASGTSSKSSKLVHGGIRYLQQREYRLVYDALRERQIALRNAPHLVRVLPFLIPILTRDGLIDPRIARALGTAMWLYDLTGGARIGKLHRRISKATALEHMPTLNPDRLASAYLYYDAQTDDARLTLTIARTAAIEHDAVIANHASVAGVLKNSDGRVSGVRVKADGDEFDLEADAVVNAAGVWADDVRAFDEGAHPGSIRPAKGVHITVPWSKVRNDIAAIVPVPRDRRSIFVVPWGEFTYIGTTDTDYDGPLDDPACTHDDVRYLLDAMNTSLASPLHERDVTGTWAGLRPLLASAGNERTADLSRRHAVARSVSGMVTVTGGKLTTYRSMAADAVDAVTSDLGRGGSSRTRNLALLGGREFQAAAGGEPSRHEHLAGRYGTLAAEVLALVDADPALGEPLVPGLPYLRAEAVYAVRAEMARSVDDVLSRRTRSRLLARDASARVADDVARIVGDELGWSDGTRREQAAAYRRAVTTERESAELPETALDSSIGA